MKESAKIGQPDDAQTTFVYSAPVDPLLQQKLQDSGRTLVNNTAENLSVVPRESRRGGRAYNIHQHVNEVWETLKTIDEKRRKKEKEKITITAQLYM